MKILILHAYSSENAGDGLLVEETMNVLRASSDERIEFTILASYPESFKGLDAQLIRSRPTKFGYSVEFIRTIVFINKFEILVGVGGGYLRAGHLLETVKMTLVHGPQLLAAALSTKPTIYMPQSVGPSSGLSRRLLRSAASRMDFLYLRDDRSVSELSCGRAMRIADLAILTGSRANSELLLGARPVLSVRAIRGSVPPMLAELAEILGPFDGYLQSDTAGNSDSAAMKGIGPTEMLTRRELMGEQSQNTARVVIAVRLHAALMAMRAGHYVVHLAYERKGYGAFSDLGLEDYVHNVNRFEPERVARQARLLLTSPSARADYDRRCTEGFSRAKSDHYQLIETIKCLSPETSKELTRQENGPGSGGQ